MLYIDGGPRNALGDGGEGGGDEFAVAEKHVLDNDAILETESGGDGVRDLR